MGDAKRRADALRVGQPWPCDYDVCPKCSGRRTMVAEGPSPVSSGRPLMGVCADCETVWEAFPPDWQHDAVAAEPCDNCAFRAGSPESQDKGAWRSLLAKLRMGQEFKCHKGCPIHIDKAASTAEFDAAWVKRHGRSCAGFVRAMQAWPDWLDNHLSVGHVTTRHDQDRFFGTDDAEPWDGEAVVPRPTLNADEGPGTNPQPDKSREGT